MNASWSEYEGPCNLNLCFIPSRKRFVKYVVNNILIIVALSLQHLTQNVYR